MDGSLDDERSWLPIPRHLFRPATRIAELERIREDGPLELVSNRRLFEPLSTGVFDPAARDKNPYADAFLLDPGPAGLLGWRVPQFDRRVQAGVKRASEKRW